MLVICSAHLLGRSDTHERQTAPDYLPDAKGEFQPRTRKLWIFFNEEAPIRIVVAAMPQGVEGGRQIIQVESDPMRLMTDWSLLKTFRLEG